MVLHPEAMSLTMPRTVSVVIPVYNHEHAIGKVVGQVMEHGLPCILVDDGSDKTEALRFLDKLEPDFTRRSWRLIRQENRYLGAAMEQAVRFAAASVSARTPVAEAAAPAPAAVPPSAAK